MPISWRFFFLQNVGDKRSFHYSLLVFVFLKNIIQSWVNNSLSKNQSLTIFEVNVFSLSYKSDSQRTSLPQVTIYNWSGMNCDFETRSKVKAFSLHLSRGGFLITRLSGILSEQRDGCSHTKAKSNGEKERIRRYIDSVLRRGCEMHQSDLSAIVSKINSCRRSEALTNARNFLCHFWWRIFYFGGVRYNWKASSYLDTRVDLRQTEIIILRKDTSLHFFSFPVQFTLVAW